MKSNLSENILALCKVQRCKEMFVSLCLWYCLPCLRYSFEGRIEFSVIKVEGKRFVWMVMLHTCKEHTSDSCPVQWTVQRQRNPVSRLPRDRISARPAWLSHRPQRRREPPVFHEVSLQPQGIVDLVWEEIRAWALSSLCPATSQVCRRGSESVKLNSALTAWFTRCCFSLSPIDGHAQAPLHPSSLDNSLAFMSHALLLRLFLSPSFFSVTVALQYLTIYHENIGITYYLTRRLREFDINELRDVWGFIWWRIFEWLRFFQIPADWLSISHLLVSRPSKSRALESFVVDISEQSSHMAMFVRRANLIPLNYFLIYM